MKGPTIMNDTAEVYTDDTHPNVRVRLVYDLDPSMPDGDAYAPAVRVHQGGRMFRSAAAEYIGDTYRSDALDVSRIADAWERWGDWDKIGRWLRMFYGVTTVETIDTREGDTIVIYDTPDFRRDCVSDTDDDLPDDLLSGDVATWRAWLDGEVFGVIVEKRATATTVVREPDTGDVIREESGDVWEHEDSCYGYFGRTYAEQEARDQLQAYIKDTAGE